MAMDSALKNPFVKFQVAPPSIVLSVPKPVPTYTMFGSFGSIAMAVAQQMSGERNKSDAPVRALEDAPEAADVDRVRRRMRSDRRFDGRRAGPDGPPAPGLK